METQELGIISRYSRADAIADGVLVDLSALEPQLCRSHYRYPVACTASVWALISEAVENPDEHNDLRGVLHDVLWMSHKNIIERPNRSEVLFKVIITGCKSRASQYLCRGRKGEIHTLKMNCGPGDDFEPVMTLMCVDED